MAIVNQLKTQRNFVGNGSQTSFNFAMDYLQKNFIYLSVDKVSKVYGSDYVISDQDIIILVAPPLNSDLVIRRITSTKPLVTWNDATVLTASDMTMSEVQLLHIAEEQSDIAEGSRGDQDVNIERCLKAPIGINAELPNPLVAGEYIKVNSAGTGFETASIIPKGSKSVDGGNARSVYTDTQIYDGGGARG